MNNSGKKKKKFTHAYLFYGLAGTGKKRAVASLVSEMIGKTVSEKELFAGFLEDVIVIAPQIEEKKGKKVRKDISVQQTRQAIKDLSFFPSQLKFRFLLIDGAEHLNQSAANSLLKVVEEPPVKARIIFLADNLEKILPTLRSRLRKRFFPLLVKEELQAQLENNLPEAKKDLLEKISLLAHGRIVLAEKFLADEILMLSQEKSLSQFRLAVKGGAIESFALAESLAKDKDFAQKAVDNWVFYLRNFLVEKVVIGQLEAPARKKMVNLIAGLLLVKEKLERPSVNARLLWENFFLSVS